MGFLRKLQQYRRLPKVGSKETHLQYKIKEGRHTTPVFRLTSQTQLLCIAHTILYSNHTFFFKFRQRYVNRCGFILMGYLER